jgi:hypothetical protein
VFSNTNVEEAVKSSTLTVKPGQKTEGNLMIPVTLSQLLSGSQSSTPPSL